MGMSASQMRYCLIAGRKSDVEYQGQQINQQRTTLATTSSAYNSELLDLTVPTPPSTTDYTKTDYNFTQSGVTCDISSTQVEDSAYYITSDGNVYDSSAGSAITIPAADTSSFLLQYSTDNGSTYTTVAPGQDTSAIADTATWRYSTNYTNDNDDSNDTYTALQSGLNWSYAANNDGTYTMSSTLGSGATSYDAGTYVINYTEEGTADVGKLVGTKSITSTADKSGNYTYYLTTASGEQTQLTQVTDLNDTTSDDYTALSVIRSDCNTGNTSTALSSENGNYYKYTSSGVTYYFTKSELESLNNATTTNGSTTYSGSTGNVNAYYVDYDANTTVSKKMGGANITWSETGRMESFSTTDSNNNKVTYDLTVTTTTDNDAYNDAYNEYEYQKGEYDSEVQKINAQLSVIEEQDRTLELKLKDLDTQQEALSTEMDSVKKVIDKNIENSFKTFA